MGNPLIKTGCLYEDKALERILYTAPGQQVYGY